VAALLYERLVERFGEGGVFLEIETMHAGATWTAPIERALRDAGAMLVVIGPGWLGELEQHDYVRAEVAAALGRDVRVIPVLVHGASMPSPQELPVELGRLTRREAFEVADSSLDYDVQRLVDLLARDLAPPAEPQAPSEQTPLGRRLARRAPRRRVPGHSPELEDRLLRAARAGIVPEPGFRPLPPRPAEPSGVAAPPPYVGAPSEAAPPAALRRKRGWALILAALAPT
jgi:TIR domain